MVRRKRVAQGGEDERGEPRVELGGEVQQPGGEGVVRLRHDRDGVGRDEGGVARPLVRFDLRHGEEDPVKRESSVAFFRNERRLTVSMTIARNAGHPSARIIAAMK